MLEDITYLPGLEKTMYLNTIENLYNGEILAYCISDSPNAKLCADTIEILCGIGASASEALSSITILEAHISYEYRNAVKSHGIVRVLAESQPAMITLRWNH